MHTPPVHSLALNYRTHAGILDCAHVCVTLLKAMFPLALDTLPRERAFFDGPAPLLLNSFNEEDLAILVSGTDKATSQVEFGAHQVVLVRSKESFGRLPEALRLSSALIMTVAQAKGLVRIRRSSFIRTPAASPGSRALHTVAPPPPRVSS